MDSASQMRCLRHVREICLLDSCMLTVPTTLQMLGMDSSLANVTLALQLTSDYQTYSMSFY